MAADYTKRTTNQEASDLGKYFADQFNAADGNSPRATPRAIGALLSESEASKRAKPLPAACDEWAAAERAQQERAVFWLQERQSDSWHELMPIKKMNELAKSAEARGDREKARILHAVRCLMLNEESLRPSARPPGEIGTAEQVFALESSFPNFADVIQDIGVQADLFHAARAGGERAFLRLPPLLLWGEPGTGKTSFLEALSRVLGVPLFMQPCHSSLPAHTFSGLAAGYASANPGRVFEVAAASPIATPLFVLDEIDKLDQSGEDSPLGALLALFEPTTAKSFFDDFLLMPFDASRMLLATTANDPERIPAPLRSRLTPYKIGLPTEAQMRQIAREIYREMLRERGLSRVFDAEPGPGFVETVAAGSVRELKSIVERALLSARYAGRRAPIALDAKAAIAARIRNAPRIDD
ncbi:AAA family ATPase [Caballeronia sp. BCC1704]|uniref:AAA family ATPase n=1 Tax=Caballeronia sp. BCC1704 TaxID=2676300 RepID=UPI00158B5EE1|nr:AAA family ATPase [Caballeronia sp. BCC1704]